MENEKYKGFTMVAIAVWLLLRILVGMVIGL